MQIITNNSDLEAFIKRVEEESHSKFVSHSVDRSYGDKDWQPLSTNRVYWQWSGGSGMPAIEFSGIPFMFVGSKRLACHRGKDRALAQKRKYAEEKAKKMMEDFSFSSQTRAQHTKKVGCPATISISKIASFPKFKVNDNRERSRKKASRMLRMALQRDPIVWETYYAVTHQSEHSGHETEELENRKKIRSKRQKDQNTTDCDLLPPKHTRKPHLRKKCVKLTQQILDKLYFIEDQDKLEELSVKLSSLLDDLTPLSNSENERPLHLETKRARVSSAFTNSVSQKAVQRLKSKYTERVGAHTTVCRKSMTQVPAWPVHTVANTL